MKMNFMPSKDSDGKRLMHSKSDNKEARIFSFTFAKLSSRLTTINNEFVFD